MTVAVVVCASSLICSIVSNFVTDGSTKKILNLVLGAFIVCSLLLPLKNAVSEFNMSVSEAQESTCPQATNDELYSQKIVSQTEQNLEKSLEQILEQNNIKINRSEIILALKDDNSIIISSVSIYISEEYTPYVETIKSITLQNFGISPEVQTE